MRLLDANTCIEFMRGKNPVVFQRMAAADPAKVLLCSVVLAELRYGADQSRDPASENAKIDKLTACHVSLPFDDAAAVEYVRVRRGLEAAGQRIGSFDMMIAAVALVHDLMLVTHNTADFKRVSGLQIEDWQAP